jgi:hypothetical protein
MSLVGINAAVGSVRPSAGFLTDSGKSANLTPRLIGIQSTYGSLLDHDVFDVQLLEFETLRVGVGLSVLQQPKDKPDRFLRPAA